MKIFLIRHGQTDWNVQKRFQGREDIPLNDTGILQAMECGKAIKDENIKTVITSPLIRAKKTAEIIANEIGVDQVIIEEDITERHFGKISGMTPEEREAFYASGEPDDKEDWDELCTRMLNSLHKHVKLAKGNIAMVSHGASINSVLTVLSEGTTGTGKIMLKNVCINVINYENGKLILGDYNLTPEEYMQLKESK